MTESSILAGTAATKAVADNKLSVDATYIKSATRLLRDCASRYSPAFVWLADRLSRLWLLRSRTPYLHELDYLAALMPLPGTYFLNLGYEWCCTTAIISDPTGNRMLRTLDWGMKGLGDAFVIANRSNTNGPWISLTWPLFVGELTVIAPGRFAIAMNQAPFRLRKIFGRRIPMYADQFLDAIGTARSREMPPAHLLRFVAEQAKDVSEAVELLKLTPICRAAIFSIISPAGPVATIERMPRDAFVTDGTHCAANHWSVNDWPGTPDPDSIRRQKSLQNACHGAAFDWLKAPVLSDRTRYAAEIDFGKDSVSVVAFEDSKIVMGPTSVTF